MRRRLPLIVALVCSSLAAQPTPDLPTKPPLTPDIFALRWQWADSALAQLSLEEKVGQVFCVQSYARYKSDDDDAFVKNSELIRQGKVGGVMFARGDVYEAAMLANRYQRVAKIPLLISADMEWGVSMRIDRSTEFPCAMAIAATRNPNYAFKVGEITAKEALALGIHQNYAPTLDLNNNPYNPIINSRAFSEDPSLVATMASAFINGAQKAGMIATAKHFPGHGDTDTDSHKDLPVLNFDKSRLQNLELKPFKRAIEGGVMSVMVGHLALPKLNDGSYILPASLSPAIATDILKSELGFKGLTVTDGMGMRGVRKHFSTGEAAVRAFLAGNDVILLPPDSDEAHYALLEAVRNGVVSEDRLNESVRKLLVLKEWLGLHRHRFVSLDSVSAIVGIKPHKELAQEIADRSITLLSNRNDLLPLRDDSIKLVNISLQNSAACDVGKIFHEELQKRFRNVIRYQLGAHSNKMNYDAALFSAERAEVVVVSSYADSRAWQGKLGLDREQDRFLKKLVERLKKSGVPLALVSFGTPYLIMGYDDPDAYVCAYSAGLASETAVAKLLKGEIQPSGKLPVTIPNRYKFGDGIVGWK
ncbi:MAG: glycoside hydrolase family 3 protein [Chloroherpetonaceae bacterium]|nr:glycoside hydrolase family 3 protein [Chloroherpetonaceae bacterium]MDW8438360.1 glycoside hydrolase family 3 N-terminal domain-containing protein [Chloroherpetonaceae bacterium]